MNRNLFISVIICYFMLIDVSNSILDFDLDSDKHPFNKGVYEAVLDAELCQRQLSYITKENIQLFTRFLDAGIRLPRGVLTGNIVDLGNFHQCMAIKEQVDDMTISGKYCSIRVPVNQDLHLPDLSHRTHWKFDPSDLLLDEETINSLETIEIRKTTLKTDIDEIIFERNRMSAANISLSNVQFRLAVCIPRPCTTDQAINGLLFNLSNIGFKYADDYCRLPDDRPWAAVDYIFIVVFSILGFVTLISTSYDLYQSKYLKKDTKEISTIYRSFSVYTNTRRLLTFNSSPGSLECLDGIRALAMVWVILGHSFSVVPDIANPIEAFEWTISSRAIWVTVAPLTVDTFFLISGVLLVYTTADKFRGIDLLKNLHVFYLHRILRLFPILATVILFEASMFLHVSDGPLWNRVARHSYFCREFWWSTILYIQNYMNPESACVAVGWYLAIDIQLHILSPLILFWVLRSRRAAWISLNTGLIATLIASSVFLFIKQLPSGVISPNRQEDMQDFFLYYYMNTLTRAGPFLVGMVYGYLLHLWRKKRIEVLGTEIYYDILSIRPLTILLLLCSLIIMLVAIYCTYIAYQVDWDNQLADNIFNSFLRSFWVLALGWMIFACVQGKAELINWFLCLPIWKLPARLSYAMFLIHYPIMVGYYSSIVTPVYFTVWSIIFNFMGFLSSTLVVSFFATLLIDSPFSIIFKRLLSKGPKKSALSKPNHGVADKKQGIANNAFTVDDDNNKSQPLSETVNNGDMKVQMDVERAGAVLVEEELKDKDK